MSGNDTGLTGDDLDFLAPDFVIPIGDFAGESLPYNDVLLPHLSFITGFEVHYFTRALYPTLHINILPVWGEYTGSGVRIGSLEPFEDTHSDLGANATNGDVAPNSHGTGVAGIVVAEADNGIGAVGIAHGAQFFYATSQEYADFDIIQNSTGGPTLPQTITETGYFPDYAQAAEEGRNGLGAIWINSAGNGGRGGDTSTEVSSVTSRFEMLPVAYATALDNVTQATTFGSGIHMTVPLGAISNDAVLTTDLSGEAGSSNAESVVLRFEEFGRRGLQLEDVGFATGDYQYFSGTSAAAPIVSGAVALVLEASGNNVFGTELGWRDVQELLAISARHMGSDLTSGGDNPFVEYDGLSYVEHRPWVINGATNINGGGFHFAVDYGFGHLDVHGAVRLAETWSLTRHSHNLVTHSETVVAQASNLSFSYGNPLTFEITGPSDALELDVLELIPVFSHDAYREIQISVMSPHGTVSYLFDTPALAIPDDTRDRWILEAGEDGFGGTFEDRTILSRQFWGEESNGTWTIVIEDIVDNGNEGTLSSLGIVWKGDLASDDDIYYFTDEWALMNDANGGVATINDSVGENSLNLAAVSGSVHLFLTSGSASGIDGQEAFRLGTETDIALAITGDGDDTLNGTNTDEVLFGMRGNDLLRGFDGDDQMVGGRGNDTLWAGSGDTGDDFVVGGMGDDLLAGGAGDDLLIGGDATGLGLVAADEDQPAGNDTIFGGSGDDTILGSHWKDASENGTYNRGEEVLRGAGVNQLYGGSGSDLVVGGAGKDAIGGGTSSDFLTGAGGNDVIWGGKDSGADTLHGNDGADTLFGSAGEDLLDGGSGNDQQFGGGGADQLDGGGGADSLYGGAGDDTLTGGDDVDTFFFAGNHGSDSVTDFDPDEDILFLVNTVTDFTDLASVQAVANETTIDDQSGLLIDTGGGNSIFLVGVASAGLTEDALIL